MPELPEVMAISDQLRDACIHKRLMRIVFRSLNNDSSVNVNRECVGVYHWGKRIVMDFDGVYAIVSLAMNGRFSFKERSGMNVVFEFSHSNVYYGDPDGLGRVIIANDLTSLETAGPDYAHESVTLESFTTVIMNPKRKRVLLREFLLDQTYFSGIGKYLRSEIFYAVYLYYGVYLNPNTVLGDLNEYSVQCVFNTIVLCLIASYEAGGFTLATYYRPDGTVGNYRPLIYKLKRTQRGESVNEIKSGSKTVMYVIDDPTHPRQN
jgi:formamidopyrimidine-DNA glycosylase